MHINAKRFIHQYPSHDIQNGLITLISKSVSREIIRWVKYYSFLPDCTRDTNRVEQMFVILRVCNTSTSIIEQNFIRFLAVAEITGQFLTNAILAKLEKMV